MRQVKAGDTVRIKTAEELAAMGISANEWCETIKKMLGKAFVVYRVFHSYIEIRVDVQQSIQFRHNEYVLLPEIPERGDIVYVSDVSEEDALEKKVARIFLAYVEGTHRPFITVHELYEDRYKNGETVDIGNWRYAVKKPALQKITKDELPAFLAEHGYELEG